MITQIVKRDGRTVPFELDKITEAIYKAAKALGGSDRRMAEDLAKILLLFAADRRTKAHAPVVHALFNDLFQTVKAPPQIKRMLLVLIWINS